MTSSGTSQRQAAREPFPREAWQHIKIEMPGSLELFGSHNRGHLQVTLSNDSSHVLEPHKQAEIAYAFRVLDSEGEVIMADGIRTPLSQAVAPGERHTQIVNVAIPQQYLETAAAIRVGLLDEGRYWVESLLPGHPCDVRLMPAADRNGVEALLAAGSQIWERGKNNKLRWPYSPIMVSERHKLLYIPIAKCACTSLKLMMVKLAEVERADVAEELDIHFITDRFNTGVQLKDKPMELAREILASDEYFKFSVIRDPYERLVSAFLEKFVYKRTSRHNLAHTRPVISAIQGTDDIDLQTGISFDQFIQYILQQDPYDLDPHWRPQYLYLLGVPHLSRVFRLENIVELEQYLRQNLGITVELAHANATRKSETVLPQASTLTANAFDNRPAIHPDSFLTSPHAEAIRRYYREDFRLHQAAV